MVTRREFLLGAGALAIAPVLPAPWRTTYKGVPIILNEPFGLARLDAPEVSTIGGIDRAMNLWWRGLPQQVELMTVSGYMKTLFDQCGRDET